VGGNLSRELQRQVILAACLASQLEELVLGKRGCPTAVRNSSFCGALFLGTNPL